MTDALRRLLSGAGRQANPKPPAPRTRGESSGLSGRGSGSSARQRDGARAPGRPQKPRASQAASGSEPPTASRARGRESDVVATPGDGRQREPGTRSPPKDLGQARPNRERRQGHQGRLTRRVVPAGTRIRLRGEAAEAAAIVERTLAELGAPGHVVAAVVGPTVIRLGIAPAVVESYAPDGTLWRRARVRVAKILSRADDLALALGARSLRLEAPVPGQPYVGLEIPNPEATQVSLASLLADRGFRAFQEQAALPVALGRDVAGRPMLADLARLPHLLVAGSTGSGKSVALNSLLAALLGRRRPDELRVLVVDPKRVEFGWLEGVAHLLAPVVVDVAEAVEVLGKLESEMAYRYDLLARANVRDLAAYNAAATTPLPRLVLVVDELADLMMLAPDDVERSTCRLAQLGRAAGIHLVVATQRPSVDVLTGLIKANLPARLAFAVTSQVDSRTILDTTGAELLLGRGDLLYLPPEAPRPIRGQGALVADSDLERLARRCRRPRRWRDAHAERFASHQTAAAQAAEELARRGRELAEAHERVSASFLQRKLRIGYRKARELLARLREEASSRTTTDRRLLPALVRGEDVRAAHHLGRGGPPVSDGVAPLDEVRRLPVRLEGGLVSVHLVQVDPVRVRLVLDDVEPQAARLVVHRAPGVVEHGFDELLAELGLDLDFHDENAHGFLLAWQPLVWPPLLGAPRPREATQVAGSPRRFWGTPQTRRRRRSPRWTPPRAYGNVSIDIQIMARELCGERNPLAIDAGEGCKLLGQSRELR